MTATVRLCSGALQSRRRQLWSNRSEKRGGGLLGCVRLVDWRSLGGFGRFYGFVIVRHGDLRRELFETRLQKEPVVLKHAAVGRKERAKKQEVSFSGQL